MTAFIGASRSWACTSSKARRRTTSSSRMARWAKANPDGGHHRRSSKTTIPLRRRRRATRPSCARVRRKACSRCNRPTACAGRRWQETPVITDGAFDSQNLAFWDAHSGLYRAYWRYFTGGTTDEKNWKPSGDRAIRTATSKDFIIGKTSRTSAMSIHPASSSTRIR
jgi:hypothetical protein